MVLGTAAGGAPTRRNRTAGPAAAAGLTKKDGTAIDPATFSPLENMTITFNLGSTAGAGSGDFHAYRMYRRMERDRVAAMDAEWDEEKTREAFEERKKEMEEEVNAGHSKRAAKRKRRKEQKRAKQKLAKAVKVNQLPSDGSFLAMVLKKQAEDAAKKNVGAKDTSNTASMEAINNTSKSAASKTIDNTPKETDTNKSHPTKQAEKEKTHADTATGGKRAREDKTSEKGRENKLKEAEADSPNKRKK